MKIIKKLFGLDKLEASIQKAELDLAEANNRLAAAEAASKTAEQAEETAKLSPKERATRRKEAWVSVINTHVNKDNIRNGFFEQVRAGSARRRRSTLRRLALARCVSSTSTLLKPPICSDR